MNILGVLVTVGVQVDDEESLAADICGEQVHEMHIHDRSGVGVHLLHLDMAVLHLEVREDAGTGHDAAARVGALHRSASVHKVLYQSGVSSPFYR